MDSNLLDPHTLLWPTLLVHLERLDLGQRRQAVVSYDLAKHGVQPVQMRRLVEEDEELRSVRAGPLIRHRDHASPRVLQRRPDLVLECAAPDGLATFGVFGGWVCWGAGLHHEAGDEAVEG